MTRARCSACARPAPPAAPASSWQPTSTASTGAFLFSSAKMFLYDNRMHAALCSIPKVLCMHAGRPELCSVRTHTGADTAFNVCSQRQVPPDLHVRQDGGLIRQDDRTVRSLACRAASGVLTDAQGCGSQHDKVECGRCKEVNCKTCCETAERFCNSQEIAIMGITTSRCCFTLSYSAALQTMATCLHSKAPSS